MAETTNQALVEAQRVERAIAKSLVELHGGRIWVEDAPDGGSAFVVAVHAERAGVAVGPR